MTRPRQGHVTRRNAGDAEAIAQALQAEAAELLRTVDFANIGEIPAKFIHLVLASQTIAPTKNAGNALRAAAQLAELMGISGKGASAQEIEERLEAILARVQGKGPRRIASGDSA